MSQIKMTEKLCLTIKEERIKNNLSARQLSNKVDRSISYISSLERGKIDNIDEDTFIKIFRTILSEKSEKDFNDYMNNLLADISFELTQNEINDHEWLLQFSLTIRKLPITQDIIDFIESKLDSLNKTPEDLVNKINENTYLPDKDTLEENKLNVFFNNNKVGWSYKFNLNNTFIEDIINKKITDINYVNMLSIIYNIFLLEEFTTSNAMNEAKKFLKNHKFYTLEEIQSLRAKKLTKSSDDVFYNIELPDYEIEFDDNLEELIKHMNFFKDLNIKYASESLKTLNRNIGFDPKFMLAMFNIPFHLLNNINLSDETGEEQFKIRQKFLTSVSKLLKETIDSNKDL
jgi:transcriptional regulator with XRE-family HTH domain